VSAKDVGDHLEVSHPTANALIQDFTRLNILQETTGYQRNRIFVFDRYFKLFLD
jgi:hypothetical protein